MRRFACAAFSFAAAIFLSCYIIPNNRLLICCAVCAAASFSGFLLSGDARRRVFIIIFSLSAGFVWNYIYTAVFISPAKLFDNQNAAVTAVVLDYPSQSGFGYNTDVSIQKDSGLSICARLYYNNETELGPGDVISFTADFSVTMRDKNDEYPDTLSPRGIFLYANAVKDITVTGSDSSKFKYFPKQISKAISDRLEDIFPTDISPFMQAMLIGKRTQLNADESLTAALSISGISHVVAVSGMHVSFLVSLIGVFIKNKRLFAAISIPLLLIFMSVTGFTPSVTRAGIMQVFLVCAPLFRRESDSLTSLSASLLILLAVNPYSCASAGLQLSFAASLGIILLTERINSVVYNALHKTKAYKNPIFGAVLRFITASLATTVGALAFTLPLNALYFGCIPLIAPITNLFTLWAVSLTFIGGFITCALSFVFIPLGSAAAFFVSAAAKYIIWAARILASIPNAAVYTMNIYILIWLVYVYLMLTSLLIMRAKARSYIYPVCLAVISLCVILLLTPLDSALEGMSVTVLDVGQGQSIVISSDNYTAMIDCGGSRAGQIAQEHLASQGKTSIDLLVLTHFHSDHVNGVLYLLNRFSVTSLAIPDPDDSYLAEDIIDLARKRGVDVIYVTQTLDISLGEIEMRLYPPLVDSAEENEQGLVILCSGGYDMLVTGDMDSAGERRLLRYTELPDIDLLVVGHHGSKYSTSDELLEAVTPEHAVISVGTNNYGHPTDTVLRRLESRGIMVYRTDLQGSVTFGGLNHAA